MSKIIHFPTYTDSRGELSVLEKEVPFSIKRVYYIYNVDNSKRGFHKHRKTKQIAIAVSGSCDIIVKRKKFNETYHLTSPKYGLYIAPEDFHWMENFTKDTVLLVLASELYLEDDYIMNYED